MAVCVQWRTRKGGIVGLMIDERERLHLKGMTGIFSGFEGSQAVLVCPRRSTFLGG
jgi:hypothetical protein